MRQAPEFWSHESGPHAAPLKRALLTPLSWLYQQGAKLKARLTTPIRPGPPVICVGNLSVGGAGKTPTVIALLERLKARGLEPHALSRGYGGKLQGPVRVDEERHSFADVGDEALLLSRVAPTWVAKNKADGARAAAAGGADLIIMDDGFQNPSVAKDFSLIIIDNEAKFGNGRVFPAGPLREDAREGLARAHAVVLMGADTPHGDWRPPTPPDLPILRARITPRGPLPGGTVVAFAGIARPEKFFNALHASSVDVKATVMFPDHHPFTAEELAGLREQARRHNALLVTTEKDHVRLPPEVRRLVHCWPVGAEFEAPEALDRLIDHALDRAAHAH